MKINVATNTKLKLNYHFRENKVNCKIKADSRNPEQKLGIQVTIGDKISMTSNHFSHGIHGAAKTRNFNFLDFLLFLFLRVFIFLENLADLSIEGTST